MRDTCGADVGIDESGWWRFVLRGEEKVSGWQSTLLSVECSR